MPATGCSSSRPLRVGSARFRSSSNMPHAHMARYWEPAQDARTPLQQPRALPVGCARFVLQQKRRAALPVPSHGLQKHTKSLQAATALPRCGLAAPSPALAAPPYLRAFRELRRFLQ